MWHIFVFQFIIFVACVVCVVIFLARVVVDRRNIVLLIYQVHKTQILSTVYCVCVYVVFMCVCVCLPFVGWWLVPPRPLDHTMANR